tara:strand:+ start:906 stop:1244 length:339 start_codon:yes stop_codon:yes gene_type:complete
LFKELYSDYTQNKITTLEEDGVERCPLQLCKHIMKQVSITDKKVLEVGSSRGGGVAFLQRHPNPRSIAGLDISENNLNFCNDFFNIKSLCFLRGESESLPLDDNSYDIILNV